MTDQPAPFQFSEARNTAVYICEHVDAGRPALTVYHDEDGDWQFICDQDHSSGSEPKLVSLEQVVTLDPTINEVADMCKKHRAERSAQGAPWRIVDETTEGLPALVDEHGWSVMHVHAGEKENEPEFSYTIGLFRTFGHSELMISGMPYETGVAILNLCGEEIRQGRKFAAGERTAEIIEGFDVDFRTIVERDSYKELVGYALEFYQDGAEHFPLLQLLWPDGEGRFPGADETDPSFEALQPRLP